MRHLLDTNIFIAALKGRSEVRTRLQRLPLADLLLSPVVLGELELGVAKSAWPERNRARLADVVQHLTVVPLDAEAAHHYADIRAVLERRGTPIGANDLWIAAQARALGAVLVTDNVRELGRVDALKIDNWLQS
ncbi:MAG: type II toxin-antitoxin system VapC family toxin [Methyloversatilis sp.]|uniref:Ribonuclease VapC n=1 Tax=Methyloversatilis universalis (strain ATCC BAA-1314 / DSM 25237 / JCM 13912 / CCUG 52030 / FAM5) TaxID=1000565 RepID=F5RER8_METUF|nr:PIN domain-containing protein [Methyloversatilis universalis]EGK71399.1 PilT protein domain protein [Methyloversatilis universalis FAM5]MCP4638040.1 type II toxin-antitoxin system VapC family toxin [Methyloversatilis sp.]